MLEQIFRRVALLMAAALLFSSCSHFSQAGRQQLAYARYVRKQSHNRVKQQTKFKKVKVPPSQMPSQPAINAESQGPESVSSAGGEQSQ
jgi:PBP1b-binding outer membrane lipoprotein LpoB